MKKVYKKFTLQSVTAQGDRLPEKAQKAIKGGLENDCWAFFCPYEPCGKGPYGPCPYDAYGRCFGSSGACFDGLDSACKYGFSMWPCEY